jgi:hypothetical protein
MPATLHQPEPAQRWRLVIPHSQILTLWSVPIALVPAPAGANEYYQIHDITVCANVAAGAYTANANTTILQFFSGNSSGVLLANTGSVAALGANVNFIAKGGVYSTAANTTISGANGIMGQGITVQLFNGLAGGVDLTGGNANNALVVEVITYKYNGDTTQV